jgi:hypothetical protein
MKPQNEPIKENASKEIDFDAPDELFYKAQEQELDVSVQNLTNIFTETNELVKKLTSFSDFHDLLTAEEYYPSLACSLNDDAKRLADLYDQAQKLRGDSRRAMRY